MKGRSGYGFEYERRDLLYNFYSISVWCKTASMWNYHPDSVELSSYVENGPAFTNSYCYFDEVFANRFQIGTWNIEFEDRKKGLEINLESSIGLVDRAVELVIKSTQAQKLSLVENDVWEYASTLTSLRRLDVMVVGNDLNIKLSKPVVGEGSYSDPGEHFLTMFITEEAKQANREIAQFATYLVSNYTVKQARFYAQILTENIADLFQRCRREVAPDCYITFQGEYHEGFHPDQVLGTVPQEGYWRFPMFAFQAAGEDSEVMVYLVQTENERFFEFEIEEKDFQKFLKRSKFDLPYETYTGPREQRWGLDKLLRDAPTFVKPAKNATATGPTPASHRSKKTKSELNIFTIPNSMPQETTKPETTKSSKKKSATKAFKKTTDISKPVKKNSTEKKPKS